MGRGEQKDTEKVESIFANVAIESLKFQATNYFRQSLTHKLPLIMSSLNFIFTLLFFELMPLTTPSLPAYQLFNKQGNTIAFDSMLLQMQQADVILFGELHNNPICHWLQLQATKQLHAKKGENLILAAEMFEADNQLILDEFLTGKIKDNHFESEAKIWNNYATDYKPLVLFAKENKLKFVAANIPRRYASLVAREGLEALTTLNKQAKALIAPQPIEVDLELPGYKNMLAMMGNHGGEEKANNFAYAQAAKDATMAHFILKNRKKDQQVLHFNGTYHSDNFEGISWYLKKNKPKLKIMTISSVEQTEIKELEEENTGKADFILVIPSDMTKTY